MRALRRLPLISTVALGWILLGLHPAPAAAQPYDGTFTVPNQVGGVMSLHLVQTGAAVSGTLSSNGAGYTVQGHIEDGALVGTMSGPDGTLHFAAERWEDELWLELYGSDASGQPNYDDYTEIDLVLEGGGSPQAAATGTSGASASGNPLGGQAGDPYLGTFSDGNVTLQLQGGNGQYRGQVSVAGASYPVEAQGDADGIQGVIQAPDGQYAIVAQSRGDGLAVASGGMQYALRRIEPAAQGGAASGGASASSARVAGGGATSGAPSQAGGQPGQTGTGRALAPGFTEDHPQVREWVAFLAGNKVTRMSSYSSGSAGGYSARTDVYLCSDRSYAMRDESSVSVDVGGAFGNNGGVGGDQGQWYVITNGQVVGLVLESRTGEVSEFRMEYQNQETYANGERVYVTPAEVCR
jgi:hypothetical protein